MLNNHAGRLAKRFYAFKCSVGIGDVVIREGFALKHFCCGNAGFACLGVNVESCLLVRVFAVPHILLFLELQVKGAWERFISGIDLTA